MKSKAFFPLLILAGTCLVRCDPRDNTNDATDASKLATVRVGDLANLPAGEKALYTKLELTISGVESDPFETTLSFNKSADSFEDTRTQLDFGRYHFLLSYKDNAGNTVFESCAGGKDGTGQDIADEKSRIHVIETSEYEPVIQVCSSSGNIATPTEASQAPASSGTTGDASQSESFGLNDRFYVDPGSLAATDASSMRNANDPNTSLIDYIAKQGSAVWLGAWSGNISAAVRAVVDKAQQQDAWALLVAYNIPYRDCGLYSAGGLEASRYLPWMTDLANAVGTRKAIVILEPDAVPGLVQKKDNGEPCLTPELRDERIKLIKGSIDILKTKPNLKVYIDAGHSQWLSASEAATLLNQVGIAQADGFALNVSNYQATPAQIAYGLNIRSQLGSKSFLIDTSRNGIDPAGSAEWCNPRNRALGKAPSFNTGTEGVAAFIWGKRPGESDGTCNGGPAAGAWWREIAIELARNAGIK